MQSEPKRPDTGETPPDQPRAWPAAQKRILPGLEDRMGATRKQVAIQLDMPPPPLPPTETFPSLVPSPGSPPTLSGSAALPIPSPSQQESTSLPECHF